jgi:hypothetical protein
MGGIWVMSDCDIVHCYSGPRTDNKEIIWEECLKLAKGKNIELSINENIYTVIDYQFLSSKEGYQHTFKHAESVHILLTIGYWGDE